MANVKTRLACEWSIGQLIGDQSFCYMWTFTFVKRLHVKEASRRWSVFRRDGLVRVLGVRGVRAFELHPNGHGLHVHMITVDRYNVNQVRILSNRYGFGRINVVLIRPEKACYIAKTIGSYITKSQRELELKGMRLWACVGFKATRVKDVEIDSPLSRMIRRVTKEQVSYVTGGRVLTSRQYNYARYKIALIRYNSVTVDCFRESLKTMVDRYNRNHVNAKMRAFEAIDSQLIYGQLELGIKGG